MTLAFAACSKDSTPTAEKAPPVTASAQESGTEKHPHPPLASKEAPNRSFESELADADRRIDGMRRVAEGNPRSPAAWERLAGAYLARARLTGDYDDYAKAEELIDTAFSIEERYGPWMARARLNYTLHRLDRVDADFEKHRSHPHKDDAAKAADLAFAANLAVQRGNYDDAVPLFEQSLAAKRTFSNLSAFAVNKWKTGDFDGAQILFQEALATYRALPREPVAWTHLQLGLMDLDRGRYDEALAHYRDAESQMQGWWLVEEHIAEILTLTGKTEDAKTLYLDIIDRTGNPEFMDALAGILLEEGKEAEAKPFVERADQRYQELLARYPEAAYGHALEHYLEHGESPQQALEMAKKNHALRPNAEAKILLARAHLAAGNAREAEKVIARALGTPWATADLHSTAAEVFEARGDAKRAQRERAVAREINPRARS